MLHRPHRLKFLLASLLVALAGGLLPAGHRDVGTRCHVWPGGDGGPGA